MEDSEFDDPRWTDLKGRLLQDARSDFAKVCRASHARETGAV
jgi:hypothetical protein